MDKEINLSLLHMIEHPAFCVQEGVIIQSNQAAMQLLILEGVAVADILQEDDSAYRSFTEGCLYLTVTTAGVTRSATVTRLGDMDLFMLQDTDIKLQAFELAAQQLSVPFSDVLLAAEQLARERKSDPGAISGLHKGLNQMHRILCNMTDTGRYRQGADANLEQTDLTAFFSELMEKLAQMVSLAGNTLQYEGLSQPFIGLADRIMLERAVSNLLTNAIKFSAPGSVLTATLTKTDDLLRFSLLDPGDRAQQEAQSNLFTRYMRSPAPEDPKHGMGLGLPLVAAIAAIHGGTTLVDHPTEHGTRVSFTMRQCARRCSEVHSPIKLPRSDYAGGRDRGLLEFADVLPKQAFSDQE